MRTTVSHNFSLNVFWFKLPYNLFQMIQLSTMFVDNRGFEMFPNNSCIAISSLNTDCHIAMYKSFISSNFSYCPVSWIFCGKRNSDKLEGLLVLYFLIIRAYIENCQFLSLSAIRIRYLAIEMYKCVHGLNLPYLNELFKNKDTRYHLRDYNRLQQPEFQTVRYGFKSFRYYGSKLWNALPAEVKKSENLHHFKKNITQWCASAKCDVFIIQWYTWYIHICIYIMYIFIYILLYMRFITSFYQFYL